MTLGRYAGSIGFKSETEPLGTLNVHPFDDPDFNLHEALTADQVNEDQLDGKTTQSPGDVNIARPQPTGLLRYIGLLFIAAYPAARIIRLIQEFLIVDMLSRAMPILPLVFIIDLMISLVLIALSFYVGVEMLKVRPRAIQKARRLLWALLMYRVASVLWPVWLNLRREAYQEMTKNIELHIAFPVIIFCLLYGYLLFSKQVKTLFPDSV